MKLFYRKTIVKRIGCIAILCLFFLNSTIPATYAQSVLLPQPGHLLPLSPRYTPSLMQGMKIYPQNPLRFDFLISPGSSKDDQNNLSEEAKTLIKYFLATLTIPEEDAWVNLSPYEKDRIIPEKFAKTAMGRDLLAEDYLLKQITSSLMYPESETGKKFWEKIYQQAYEKYGTTEIPMDSFHKVWIVPDKAIVYENAESGTAYVIESSMKVMLEEDYISSQKSVASNQKNKLTTDHWPLATKIIRQIIIPELEKEVNQGENFAQLRQVYHSLILATWFKRKLKNNILNQIYSDKNKTKGIDIADKQMKEKIYARYLEAFRKGAYNYIKEEYDPIKKEIVPRKYFSGGMNLPENLQIQITHSPDFAMTTHKDSQIYKVRLDPAATKTSMPTRIKSVPLPQTTQQIIDSLGNLEAQDAYHWQDAPSLNGRIAKNPIQLTKQGKDFFNELFHGFTVSKDAELVLLKTLQKGQAENISPLGIMIYDDSSNKSIFFNLTPLTLTASELKNFETNVARESLKFLNDPNSHGQQITILNLLSQQTDFPNPEIQKILLKKYGMIRPFNILSIENDNIFHATGAFSKDFQQAVCTKSDIFKNKSVHETGVGTGINLLYSIKFGAKVVQGTDISLAHTLLTEWNLRYAMETNQIPSLSQKNITIVHGNGFADLPNADIYLFNTPAIMPKETIEERIRAHLTDLLSGVNNLTDNIDVFKNVFIGTDQFSRLFSELKARLKNSKAQAIWRIRIYNYLAQKELQIPITPIIANKNPDQAYFERASNFFKYQNLVFNKIESPREFEIPDIFSFRYEPSSVQWQDKEMISDHYDNAMAIKDKTNVLIKIEDEMRGRLINKMLEVTGGDKEKTARVLGAKTMYLIDKKQTQENYDSDKALFLEKYKLASEDVENRIRFELPNFTRKIQKKIATIVLEFYAWDQTKAGKALGLLESLKQRENARQWFERLDIYVAQKKEKYDEIKAPIKKDRMMRALQKTNGNKELTAYLLGITRGQRIQIFDDLGIDYQKQENWYFGPKLESEISIYKEKKRRFDKKEEAALLKKVLRITNGNFNDAGFILGRPPKTIQNRAESFGIALGEIVITKETPERFNQYKWEQYQKNDLKEYIRSLNNQYDGKLSKFLTKKNIDKIFAGDAGIISDIAAVIAKYETEKALHRILTRSIFPIIILKLRSENTLEGKDVRIIQDMLQELNIPVDELLLKRLSDASVWKEYQEPLLSTLELFTNNFSAKSIERDHRVKYDNMYHNAPMIIERLKTDLLRHELLNIYWPINNFFLFLADTDVKKVFSSSDRQSFQRLLNLRKLLVKKYKTFKFVLNNTTDTESNTLSYFLMQEFLIFVSDMAWFLQNSSELLHRNAQNIKNLDQYIESFDTGLKEAKSFLTMLEAWSHHPALFTDIPILDMNAKLLSFLPSLKRLYGIDMHYAGEGSIDIQMFQHDLNFLIKNLIKNAAYATRHKKDALIKVSLRKIKDEKQEYAELIVADNGTGMDKKSVNKINAHNPFTKGKEQGSGLGLASVHEILGIYQGTLSVTSQPNKGSKFIIRLPISNTNATKDKAMSSNTTDMPDTPTQPENHNQKTKKPSIFYDQDFFIQYGTRLMKLIDVDNLIVEAEKKYEFLTIQWMLFVTQGDSQKSADLLGISKERLYRRINYYRSFFEKISSTPRFLTATFTKIFNLTEAKKKFKKYYIEKIFKQTGDLEKTLNYLKISERTFFRYFDMPHQEGTSFIEKVSTGIEYKPLANAVDEFERRMVTRALMVSLWNEKKAAELLGLNYKGFNAKLMKLTNTPSDEELEKYHFKRSYDNQIKNFKKSLTLSFLNLYSGNSALTGKMLGINGDRTNIELFFKRLGITAENLAEIRNSHKGHMAKGIGNTESIRKGIAILEKKYKFNKKYLNKRLERIKEGDRKTLRFISDKIVLNASQKNFKIKEKSERLGRSVLKTNALVVERELIRWALTLTRGNMSQAAELLNMPKTSFVNKMKRSKTDPERFKKSLSKKEEVKVFLEMPLPLTLKKMRKSLSRTLPRVSVDERIRLFETEKITSAIRRENGILTKAAELLLISEQTLARRLKKLNIDPEKYIPETPAKKYKIDLNKIISDIDKKILTESLVLLNFHARNTAKALCLSGETARTFWGITKRMDINIPELKKAYVDKLNYFPANSHMGILIKELEQTYGPEMNFLEDRINDIRQLNPQVFKDMAKIIRKKELRKITSNKSRDFAMAQPTTQNKGGIDFNGNNLEIETRGEGIDFALPDSDIEKLKNMHFDGFTPVILEIVPLTNLPMFLGLKDERTIPDKNIELSKVIP